MCKQLHGQLPSRMPMHHNELRRAVIGRSRDQHVHLLGFRHPDPPDPGCAEVAESDIRAAKVWSGTESNPPIVHQCRSRINPWKYADDAAPCDGPIEHIVVRDS